MRTEFFVILDCFLPFYLFTDPENQNFENIKIVPGDIIILHMCTINGNHMMYVSWDMEHDRHNFLSFWTVSCPFTPPPSLTTQKIRILQKMKKNTWRYYHFTHVYNKWQSCNEWFLKHGARQTEFFVILDSFLLFYPSNNLKK